VQFHRICSPFWRLERKLTEVAAHFGVPQSDRFHALTMLGRVFAKKVPCVGPNSIRTVGAVLWLQSQCSGGHSLLLNEVASVVNASVGDISRQASRLRQLLGQTKMKCPKAALCARLSSLCRRILEHLDAPLTAFIALNLPMVSVDFVKLGIKKNIDRACDFVAIVSCDEGSSPSGIATAITFLSCSIAALNQQAYVSFARATAVRQASRKKRSLRTTLLPLLRRPWGMSMEQCADVAGVSTCTAASRLKHLEAAFDECIARYFVALFPSETNDMRTSTLLHIHHDVAHMTHLAATSKIASCEAVVRKRQARVTAPITLYNRIPIVLEVGRLY
jgi:hypothetical protein